METNNVPIKPHNNKRYLIRATKIEVLKYVREREIVVVNDLVEHFGYKPEGSRRRLYALAEEGLLTSWVSPGRWCLTQEGIRRLKYYADKENKED
ncbi:MAG: hypothetical protein PHI12_06535 [Dehalococcoidales bacterium]|nr:hypothetical protein [Dehalococcoidales bacterium]